MARVRKGASAPAVAGYSGTPLVRKLGIKEGWKVTIIGAPASYRALLVDLPPGVSFGRTASARTPMVHLFVTRREELAMRLTSLRGVLAPEALLWISWPKKSSGVASTVDEGTIRELALPLGFVDVKVCAVDETWSGLKLVVRKSLR